MAISTNINNKVVQKIIQPGNVTAKINNIYIKSANLWKEGAYEIKLNIETAPLENFEGFFIDKNDPSKGHYAGQIGDLSCTEFPFADGESKTGIKFNRDIEILKFLKRLCDVMQINNWFNAQDNKHATIEDFIIAMNNEQPFKNIYLNWCIAGREYHNKQGYVNYNLFIPKVKSLSAQVVFELSTEPNKFSDKLIMFNAKDHVRSKSASSVKGFDEHGNTSSSATEFTL